MLISAHLLFDSHPNFCKIFNTIPSSYVWRKPFASKTPTSMSTDTLTETDIDATISLQEWQGWGTVSPVPAMVNEVIRDMKLLEKDIEAPMTFGGNHGALTGGFKVEEEKKHRAKYASLNSSERKLQFFSARQIACRLLGSRDYLCQKCWLPQEDCICSKISTCSLWHKLRIWLYMHPKDFLRQNNTGKLLWQVFGVQAASLCISGIAEHEEMMWNELNSAGRNRVWCLYPNKNAVSESVTDIVSCSMNTENHAELVTYITCIITAGSSLLLRHVPKAISFTYSHTDEHLDTLIMQVAHFLSYAMSLYRNVTQANKDDKMHFILIDGTWSNSAAMFRRLQTRAESEWGKELRCISLNTGASVMHKLRPQPSWDRTCTAGAAISLLEELKQVPECSSLGLDKQAEAIDNALEVLLEGLVARRLRRGRSISRKERHNWDIW